MVIKDHTQKLNPPLPSLGFQIFTYFTFAVLMVLLNIVIQNFHLVVIYPWLEPRLNSIPFFQTVYLSTNPYNMPEIVGSALAVLITYVLKFFLDKFVVFHRNSTHFKEMGRQFGLYFIFAILTTGENLLIQFLLGIWTNWILNVRIIIALTFGYVTKFLLDRYYSFKVVGNKR